VSTVRAGLAVISRPVTISGDSRASCLFTWARVADALAMAVWWSTIAAFRTAHSFMSSLSFSKASTRPLSTSYFFILCSSATSSVLALVASTARAW
jgi:hypothetical protein